MAENTSTITTVPSVNCTVNEGNSKLVFTLNATLAGYTTTFIIKENDKGEEYGLLEIKNGEKLERRYTSSPFPKGSIEKEDAKSAIVEKRHVYKVKLKKKIKDIKLESFFRTSN